MAFRFEPELLEVRVLFCVSIKALAFMVPRRGLEPPCLAATASKAVVSAISPPGRRPKYSYFVAFSIFFEKRPSVAKIWITRKAKRQRNGMVIKPK